MPTQWLTSIGVKRIFHLAQGDYSGDPLPEWAGLLIWAGWWMRRAQVSRTRIFMVLLLPSRSCAASLVALGTMIGSLGRTGRSLDWGSFLELPAGTPIFLRMKDRTAQHKLISVEGRIGSIDGRGRPNKGTIALVSTNPRFHGATIFPSAKAFFEYDVSLTRHATARQARKLLGISRIYSTLSDDFDDAWMSSASRESAIVTNKARWARETEGLNVVSTSALREEIEASVLDLLVCGAPGIGDEVRTLLASPMTIMPESNQIPVGVLDGAEALRSFDLVHCPNILVLLEQSEYDEEVHDQLTRLNSARNNESLPDLTDIPKDIPSGIDMIMFALNTGDA